MEYNNYMNSPTNVLVSVEQFDSVQEYTKAENAKQFQHFMLALTEKRKIDAIRSLRSIAEFSLKEAKDLVENLMENKHTQTPGKFCVVREYKNGGSIRQSLSDCREDAEYILKIYPGEPVYICQVISESQEVTTYKMVDL